LNETAETTIKGYFPQYKPLFLPPGFGFARM
jgi:hypothetical protein